MDSGVNPKVMTLNLTVRFNSSFSLDEGEKVLQVNPETAG